jgi:hypothetical protein
MLKLKCEFECVGIWQHGQYLLHRDFLIVITHSAKAFAMACFIVYLLYFSRDFAKSVLCIHFVPQFQTVVSPSILDRFA